jgi:hypothetical protein
MKPERILGEVRHDRLPIEPNDDNLSAASAFALEMWRRRWEDRRDSWLEEFGCLDGFRERRPEDLSGSCKFTSLFAAAVFGGAIDGNFEHQYAVKDGAIIDLNLEAEDVRSLAAPHARDPLFFGSRDHLASMRTCAPRVNAWLAEFDRRLAQEHRPPNIAP